MALSVISRNQRSTRLSQELEVGVKCRWFYKEMLVQNVIFFGSVSILPIGTYRVG